MLDLKYSLGSVNPPLRGHIALSGMHHVWEADNTDTRLPGASVCLLSTFTQRNVEPVGQPVHMVLIRCETCRTLYSQQVLYSQPKQFLEILTIN